MWHALSLHVLPGQSLTAWPMERPVLLVQPSAVAMSPRTTSFSAAKLLLGPAPTQQPVTLHRDATTDPPLALSDGE